MATTKLHKSQRRGNALVLTVGGLVPFFGMVALSIDLGLMSLAQTQAQNAADLAAMTGVRTLNGSAGNNASAAPTNALNMVRSNMILSSAVDPNNVTIKLGRYVYDTVNQQFVPQIPGPATQNFSLVQATVNYTGNYAFAKVLGINNYSIVATAEAVHRPRDVCVVLDFSGSMNNESDLWNCEGYLGNMLNTPNNMETVYPLFGHYSNVSSASLAQTSTSNTLVGECNVSQAAAGTPALVNDFVQSGHGVSPSVSAFTSQPDSYAWAPQGDNFLFVNRNNGASYATTVADVTGSTSRNSNFESKGYRYYTGTAFNGYTTGPRFWGKTFFVWPPDPTNDWRKKFFIDSSTGQPLADNTKLWNASGNLQQPGGSTYTINYAAILNWIQNTGPNPFPAQLRAPRLSYYSAIPSDVPASAYNWSNSNSQITDASQRFWKEYIDFALGVWRDPLGNVQTPGSPTCSYGPDFTWGTVQVSAKPGTQYMNYADNPKRPRHRFWFGPMTMVQYISDTGIAPGTFHDISMFAAKIGVQSAMQDIQTNHPNDLISLLLFSRPHFANEPVTAGAFNTAQCNLGNDYTAMMNALWYAPNSAGIDVTPWDSNGLQCPRSHGDYDSNTCSNYGFMLAHNQFYSDANLAAQGNGGAGRKGSNRLIIFETDGMANCAADYSGTFNGQYYNIGGGSSLSQSTSGAAQAVTGCVNRLVALTTDYTNGPGFSTPSKPVVIHCLAFGAIFQPDAPASYQTPAVNLLQAVSTAGQTEFPSSASDPANGYKWVVGDLPTRQAKLQQAFQNIMNSMVGVSLIQ
jgi:Flp pilus assembly protein TadG